MYGGNDIYPDLSSRVNLILFFFVAVVALLIIAVVIYLLVFYLHVPLPSNQADDRKPKGILLLWQAAVSGHGCHLAHFYQILFQSCPYPDWQEKY